MSDDAAPRELWQLARALDETASGHDRAAELMEPFDDDLANGLTFLGASMRETARQIRAGRYGPPGNEPTS